jgi:uncharacterized glyoxalase superfamily protein PhnB
MTDPLDALRQPVEPAVPDPRFAAELRDKLRRAVLLGEEMTTTETATGTLTPYLAVSDARAALDFYVDVFGATRRGAPIVMDDGRVGHAELEIGGALLMLAEEFEEIGHVASMTGGASIRVEVPDPARVVDRALQLGAVLIRPVTESPYGTSGAIRDPFGQRWLVSQGAPKEAVGQTVRHGAAGYFTFQVPDDTAAKDFYGAVLGWQFSPGSVPDAWGIDGHGLQGGLWGGPDRQVGWKLMYAVDDLQSALARVRDHGGQTGEVEQHPYGQTVDCTDNQGIEFWLWQQP